jgi:thiol-disulfide isomerase/thioredoxin
MSGGAVKPKQAGARRLLHLRAGDTIECDVTRIDERGVTFHSAVSEATFVAHDQVQAVELAQDSGETRIGKARRERLLTLPRMQKDNPPTHLVCSTNGDYLRGRLIEMDERQLTIEVRLEPKVLQRDRVARIIWLHGETLADAPPAADGNEPTSRLRVQAVRHTDNHRLTFFAEQLAETATLVGTSTLLGACRVELEKIDELLIGAAIEEAAAQLTYQQWKLTNAVEPKVAQAADGESPEGLRPGTESAMIGKPAPDFQLDLLDGKKFQLAQQKEKIVVLDFWATWCGPCLQSMPQVERVVAEFDGQNVQLVGVNLEETPEKITATLERIKVKTTVVLDRDGKIAAKYGATAIPQVVVIDRGGNVARVFVGGGPHFADELRAALQDVLSGGKGPAVNP